MPPTLAPVARTVPALLLLAASCARAQAPDPAPAASSAPAPAAPSPARLVLDANRMHADIVHLASDELGGRYTLADDIDRAAAYLAGEYRKAGISGVGDDYVVPYPLRTGARSTAPASLEIHRKGRRSQVKAGDFVPAAMGGSGTVTGPAVFVGYAVQVDPVEATPAQDGKEGSPARPGYDDLAGVELKGKVAVFLLDAPGRPSLMATFRRMQDIAEEFETDAKPLQAEEDAEKLAALHLQARRDLGGLLQRFLGGRDLPEGFYDVPEDPGSSLDLGKILGPVMAQSDAAETGPKFGFGAESLRAKLNRVADAGAVGAVIVRGPASFLSDAERDGDALPELADAGLSGVNAVDIPVVQMRWKAAEKLLRIGGKRLSKVQAQIDTELAPRSAELTGVEIALGTSIEPTSRDVPNVLATLPGSHSPSEIVMVGAHFDHIGTSEEGRGQCGSVDGPDGPDGICNGADDNASGTAMVLELARAMKASDTPPRRTVVFAHFSGEELGLRGSRALAESPPMAAPFAGGRIVAMINLDMVGRLGPRGLAIGGISSSSGWMPILEDIGSQGLKITYDRAITSRSDHANFYEKKIPVLFFFTYTHGDYHRATDHIDKINREGMATIGQIVADVVAALADGVEIPFTAPRTEAEGLVPGLPGTNPATVEKKVSKGG